jgi:hypothetical protein
MNEKNARLLRQFIRFCGPERLPERIQERGRSHPNPIIRDMREAFRHGASGQRRALASQLRLEMR